MMHRLATIALLCGAMFGLSGCYVGPAPGYYRPGYVAPAPYYRPYGYRPYGYRPYGYWR